MNNSLLTLYRTLFSRKSLYRLNLHLYKLSLRGIGVLNSEGPDITGEQWLLNALSKMSDIKVVFDVGSNTDVYGAKELPAAKIFAFEPHPNTFAKLQKELKANSFKNVRAFNLGISNKPGKLKLWDFAQDAELKSTQPTSTLSSFNKEIIEKLHGQKAESFLVQLETLDAIAQKQNIKRIDVLKIDTEGYEYQVLLGAKNLLKNKQIGLIQFEFNEMNVYTRTFLKDFIELLPEYEFFRLSNDGLLPLGEYRPLTHEIFAFQNIVALPKWDDTFQKALLN